MNNKAAMLGLAVVAFLVAAVLVIMIFRMLFGGRLRMPGGRSRQARLGIVDAFDLDRQRQLIIVRRDNVEHLIMIGGPNDVVVEAEIIRAEARDMRETRREPGLAPGFADAGRIPAPMPAIEKPDGGMPPQEELPLPLPTAAGGPAEPPPARGPTFPLPPRRPPPPQPERRPAPPPKLPESVSRGEDVPSLTGQPPAQAPAPPRPVSTAPTMRPPQTQPSAASAGPGMPSVNPAAPPANPAATPATSPAAAPPPPRPPFLKPPPPRPPLRPPLQRTTPQPPPPGPRPPGAPSPNGASTAPRPPGPPQASAQPPASAKEAPKGEGTDALESLEEEMAKLLGRGS